MTDPSEEDRRAAANIASSLSKLLISAGLTMLTILGAFVVIVLKDKEFSWLLVILTLLTLLAFLAMAFVGGKAIKNLYYDVYDGKWSPDESKGDFNSQAIAAIVAVLFFIATIIATFSLDTRKSSNQTDPVVPETTVIVIPDSTEQLLNRLRLSVDSLKENCECAQSNSVK